MENSYKEITFTNTEKKTWAMPELIVINKKVVEGGQLASGAETFFSTYGS